MHLPKMNLARLRRFFRILWHGRAYVEQRERFSRGLDRIAPDNLCKPSESERWRLHFLNGGSGDKLD
jgi:hypothetical protein